MFPNRHLAASALLLFVLTAHAQTAPRVEAAWARPTVNGQAGGGGFLKITGGSTNDRLLSVSAGISKMVELHTMEMDGKVMRMREIEAIAIPAGATVELKPGGKHVMFMGLTQTLKAGDRFPLTLRFEKAGDVKVEMRVSAQAPAAAVKP
jgi:periplasmic copper chaperone A